MAATYTFSSQLLLTQTALPLVVHWSHFSRPRLSFDACGPSGISESPNTCRSLESLRSFSSVHVVEFTRGTGYETKPSFHLSCGTTVIRCNPSRLCICLRFPYQRRLHRGVIHRCRNTQLSPASSVTLAMVPALPHILGF